VSLLRISAFIVIINVKCRIYWITSCESSTN